MPDASHQTELPQEEAQHATRVLRLQEGDEVFLMDGVGTFYRAQITLAAHKHCAYNIVETMLQEPTWYGHIHLAIAPTKDIGRMEWMAEKATEMGFDELSFLNCRFSERRVVREDRMEKIVVAAMKQSRKAWKPQVNAMQDFKSFIAQPCEGRKFICHCYDEIPRRDLWTLLGESKVESLKFKDESLKFKVESLKFKDDSVCVLVGPEGDFSIDEVQLALAYGYESVTLGNSRLRTETAGLTAVFMAHLALRKS